MAGWDAHRRAQSEDLAAREGVELLSGRHRGRRAVSGPDVLVLLEHTAPGMLFVMSLALLAAEEPA